MFGNEDEMRNPFTNILRIAIVNKENQSTELSNNILEKTSLAYKERLKFTHISSIKELYKDIEISPQENMSKGLINIKWIKDLINRKPSVIVYFHYIPDNSNNEEEEKKMYNEIEEIKKFDTFVYIFLMIITKNAHNNSYNFNSDDKTRTYCLRSFLPKEFIFTCPDEEVWKYFEFPNFCMNILFYSRQYYRKIKMKMREKKIKSTCLEERIEYNIMMGVLSTIKSQKQLMYISKYFDEAYDLLSEQNLDVENYVFGNKPSNKKLNYCEIRAAADWLFFKMNKLRIKSNKIQINLERKNSSSMCKPSETELEQKIERYKKHIKSFSYFNYFDNNKDPFIFIEYYWQFQRCLNFTDYLKDNLKEIHNNKSLLLNLGNLYLRQIYSLIKMIRFFKINFINKNLTTISLKNKEIPINKIELALNSFYGKPPNYIYKDIHNPLLRNELGFSEEIYIKKFIYEHKINLEEMIIKIKEKYIPEALIFYQKFKCGNFINEDLEINNIKKEKQLNGIKFYLYLLDIISVTVGEEEKKFDNSIIINDFLFKTFQTLSDIKFINKFPDVYMKFLNQYTQSLIHQMNSNPLFYSNNFQKTQLFINLIILSNIRKLKEKEEEIFFNLLNDENFVPINNQEKSLEVNTGVNKQINVYLNNFTNKRNKNILNDSKSFIFDYSVKDIDKSQERKILDLVEYNFHFSTLLSKQKIKFSSIKIYFKCINEEINKSNNNREGKAIDEVDKSNNTEYITKEYNKEELDSMELGIDSPIILVYKLFMKYRKGKIFVSKISFTLSKKDNISFIISIPNNISKIIFLTNLSKNVLKINFPKKTYIAGVNQLYKFEYEVEKEKIDDIKITDLKIHFETKPTYFFKEVQLKQIKNDKRIINIATEQSNNLQKSSSSSESTSQQLFGQSIDNNLIHSTLQSLPNHKNNFPTTNENLRKSSNNIHPSLVNSQNFIQSKSKKTLAIVENNSLISPEITSNTKKIKTILPHPELYIFNEENNSLDKSVVFLEKTYKDFESKLKENKKNYSVLFKFSHEGQYIIKFNITYSIKHKEIDDSFEFNQEAFLNFLVIEPFTYRNEAKSSNSFSFTQEKDGKKEEITTYLTNKLIKMNLILTNKLDEDINIKDLLIELDNEKLTNGNEKIQVTTNIKDIMTSKVIDPQLKNDILCILKTADYCVPFQTKFFTNFNGKLGKIILKWTTPSLSSYECGSLNLYNENVFDFPNFIVNPLELNFFTECKITDNKNIILTVTLNNNSKGTKKIKLFLEIKEELNFIISGKTKQIFNITNGETINVNFKLIPLQKGELKLPGFTIWEIDYYNSDKKSCNYYFPEKIILI